METVEQKKAEKAAYEAEMSQKAKDKAQEIINTILEYKNENTLFGGIPKDEVMSFTKEFYDKLLMPASSVALTKIAMFPYVDDKEVEKIRKTLTNYDGSESPIIVLRAENKQYILITYDTLYFALRLEEDNKFYVLGQIPTTEISDLTFEITDEFAKVVCDGYTIAQFKTDKTIKEDFLSLTNYFECIKNTILKSQMKRLTFL